MRLFSLFIATASTSPTMFETENFITSPDVQWTLMMDSVMGGGSLGAFEKLDNHIHFTGQLDIINGGFAGFVGRIDSKLTGSEVIRVSGRTPNPDRTFKVGVARENLSSTWYHALTLGTEYQSFEVKLEDFYFSYHGDILDTPPPFGSQIRQVRINISDGKDEPFEADINIIQGL